MNRLSGKKWIDLVKRDDRFVPAKDTWFVPRLIQMYWYSRLIQELVLHTTALGVTGVKVAAF